LKTGRVTARVAFRRGGRRAPAELAEDRSSTGSSVPARFARMTRSHSGSHFFQPAAYARWRGPARTVSCAEAPRTIDVHRFVDYRGQKPEVVDPSTGVVRQVELFVAVLVPSNYTGVEATETAECRFHPESQWCGLAWHEFARLAGTLADQRSVWARRRSRKQHTCRFETPPTHFAVCPAPCEAASAGARSA